jgi:hypothetical protein
MTAAPRSRAQRRLDTLEKLRSDVDLWVASADETGGAYLVPLSFVWDGTALTLATPRAGRTARNLVRAGWARVALGPTRDVVILEGPVEELAIGTDPDLEDAHAAATGFDPRTLAEEYERRGSTPGRSPRSTSTCGSRRTPSRRGASRTSSRAGG